MSHYMTARRTRILPAVVPPQGPCPPWMRWFPDPLQRDRVHAFDCDASVVETIEVTLAEEATDQMQDGVLRANVVGLYLFVKVRTLPSPGEPRGRVWVWRWWDPASGGLWQTLAPCSGPAS